MNETTIPCATIISVLNVEDEVMRAFYILLTCNQSVDEYIQKQHLYFSSRQMQGIFLSYLLALTELTLDQILLKK